MQGSEIPERYASEGSHHGVPHNSNASWCERALLRFPLSLFIVGFHVTSLCRCNPGAIQTRAPCLHQQIDIPPTIIGQILSSWLGLGVLEREEEF